MPVIQLNRLGAPYDIISFNDMANMVDFNRYKFVIFPAQHEITLGKEALLRKHVMNNNRTVRWFHAPGISDGRQLSPQRVRDISGASFKTAGIRLTAMGDWRSVYVYDCNTLSTADLKRCAAEARVTVYCDDPIPIYSNSRLLSIHVATGGKKRITLPRKYAKLTELYSGKIAAKDSKTFIWEFQTPDTVLFDLNP